MGKRFSTELSDLPQTYQWALKAPIDDLAAALAGLGKMPLIVVGSGGSFTTAEFASLLHREFTSCLASAYTPMEAVSAPLNHRSIGVLLATAGGKNPDVVGAFRALAMREPHRFLVVCASLRSPLSRIAANHCFVNFLELDLPSGKDGFLATNSLLATVIVLMRGYAEASGSTVSLPSEFSELLGVPFGTDAEKALDQQLSNLWQRDTLIVLHGPATRAASVDIESKFTEAALGNVQTADYRNFAHGRHHWLAKRAQETGILAFVTPEDENIALKTLELIPGDVPVVRFDFSFPRIVASVAALARVLYLVGSAGRAKGIDPGRPGVPTFGRRIYHLRAFDAPGNPVNCDMPANEAVAIERKSGCSIAVLANAGQLPHWRKAYASFVTKLTSAHFPAVVFDYDGTLCDEADRYKGLSQAVGRELKRLLREGAIIGIATGRGKSAKKALQESLPKKYWKQIVVGYYNGGDVGLLGEGDRPNGSERVTDCLQHVKHVLETHATLSTIASYEWRIPQIKVEPKKGTSIDFLWDLLQQLVGSLEIPGVSVLRSSHSIDVVAPEVSKRKVIDRVLEVLGGDKTVPILCVGDRGCWPGNDFSLLAGPYALSVDEVSPDPATCWNLASPGRRSSAACLEYLRRLNIRSGRVGFTIAISQR